MSCATIMSRNLKKKVKTKDLEKYLTSFFTFMQNECVLLVVLYLINQNQ